MKKQPSNEEMQAGFGPVQVVRTREDAWVFFGYSDAPPVICGSGIGAFHWFDGRSELLDFLFEFFAWYHPAPSSMEPEAIAEAVQDVITEFRAGGGRDLEGLRDELNDVMRHMWQIAWIGTLGELYSGDSDYARELRADYRESQDRDDGEEERPRDGSAILADGYRDCAEWMSEYGL